ncbi:MAG: hypothetical protein SF069_17710 [Phycisphaerae bacterium]|nr:hypothetical protein [Phycisphaerae bacterium]
MADRKKGVNIPVEVTGADKAQQELREVKAGVEGVGQSGSKAASGTDQLGQSAGNAIPKLEDAGDAAKNTSNNTGDLGDKADKAASSIFDFDSKSERAAKTLLGMLNPQLAAALDNILDLGQGIGKLSPKLGMLVGAVAFWGSIAAAVRSTYAEAAKLREELEKIEQIQSKQREGALGVRAAVADELAKAGVFDADLATGAARRTIELNRGGVRAGMAQDTAVAEAIAKAGGLAFDPDQFMAGLLAQGKTSADFGKSNAEAINMIQAALARGGESSARDALQQYRASTYSVALREMLDADPASAGDAAQSALNAALEKISEQRELTDKQRASVRRIARAGLGLGKESLDDALAGERVGFRPGFDFGPSGLPTASTMVPVSGENATTIRDAARETIDLVRGATPAGEARPTVIQNVTNIGTVFQSSDRLGDYNFNPALDRESFRR